MTDEQILEPVEPAEPNVDVEAAMVMEAKLKAAKFKAAANEEEPEEADEEVAEQATEDSAEEVVEASASEPEEPGAAERANESQPVQEDDDAVEAAPVEVEPAAEQEIPLNKIDRNALSVVKRLRSKGFEAYLTGGCVRDLLLGRSPKDFDVATSAKPEEVKKLFRNCRLVGRRFLLAHVCFPGRKVIETSTFRRNPLDVAEDLPEDLLVKDDNVYGNVEEDAIRRDLTINGLFYDPIAGKVIDYVEGRKDLEAKLIRTIGDPNVRFREDPVRMIRAIKFATRLGFSFEADTEAAIRSHSAEIIRCAASRLQEEMLRLLTSGHAHDSYKLCHDLGLLEGLMPELYLAMQGKIERDPPRSSQDPSASQENAVEAADDLEDYQDLELDEVNAVVDVDEDKDRRDDEESGLDSDKEDEQSDDSEEQEFANEGEEVKDKFETRPGLSRDEIEEMIAAGKSYHADRVEDLVGVDAAATESTLAAWLNILKAMDTVKERKVGIAPAVAFSVLLLPAFRLVEGSEENERNWIDRLCIHWSQRIRMTRHDQDRIRLLLSVIEQVAKGDVESRAAGHVVRKPWFREALLLFIIDRVAREESLDVVSEWKKLAKRCKKPYTQDRYVHRRQGGPFRRNRNFRGRGGNSNRRRFSQ